MSYSTNPLYDAQRHYAARDKEDDAQEAAEQAMQCEFLSLCCKCDANVLAKFAPMTTDFAKQALHVVGSIPLQRPMRQQLLHEVVIEALDYGVGPTTSQLVQLLLNVAYGSSYAEVQLQAAALLRDLAASFSKHNAEGQT